jgi:hypothetical protein
MQIGGMICSLLFVECIDLDTVSVRPGNSLQVVFIAVKAESLKP